MRFSPWGGKAAGNFSVVKESGEPAAPTLGGKSRWAHPRWGASGNILRAGREASSGLALPEPLPLLYNLSTRLC